MDESIVETYDKIVQVLIPPRILSSNTDKMSLEHPLEQLEGFRGCVIITLRSILLIFLLLLRAL